MFRSARRRTYGAPPAQQLLQLVALLRAQQGAEEALRLWLGPTAHGLPTDSQIRDLSGPRVSGLGSPGSFSSLFRSVSEQETASSTSLTPAFLLSLGDAEKKRIIGSSSDRGRAALLGALLHFKKAKLSFCTTEGHILLTIIKYNLNIYRVNRDFLKALTGLHYIHISNSYGRVSNWNELHSHSVGSREVL